MQRKSERKNEDGNEDKIEENEEKILLNNRPRHSSGG
jgi:hypothetical protein